MEPYILYFSEIGQSQLADVGGKGANLGEMAQAGFPVPQGFCVTTSAYRTFVETSQELDRLLACLERLQPSQLDEIGTLGRQIRDHLESIDMPEVVATAILDAWRHVGDTLDYAVRSSATAEDLPQASFAGQQETYLNVKGPEQLLRAVRKCWASLFTDRSIVYRAQNGFDHRSVFLSVIVQKMIFPEVAGIMFTADPVTGNRNIVAIDASFGLGEALVSGIVAADLYQVKADRLIKKQIAKKEIGIYPVPEGGTKQASISKDRQTAPALTDEQALRLARVGRKIEEHFGCPQDVEWCLAGDAIYILQSRPITTLYPVPQVFDNKLHLFLSFGHVQMMTEAIKPLGISVLRTLVPFGKNSPLAESRILAEAGSRLYIDATPLLEYRQLRPRIPEILRVLDESFSRAVQEFIQRAEFQAEIQSDKKLKLAQVRRALPTALAILGNILYRDNAQAIAKTDKFIAEKVEESRKKLENVAGLERITLIQEMLATLAPAIVSQIVQYMPPALLTYKLIETLAQRWLGDTAELGSISKSPPGNVTTEMGLKLGDVADALRNCPEVIEYLRHAADDTFWEGLRAVPGGQDVLPVFLEFFERYGMRGTGEIDVTRPRWRETPTQLVPALLNHLKGARPGQHRLDFLAGQEEAELAAARLLNRLRYMPLGSVKAKIMRRLIKVHRSLIGIREHPKYFLVQHLDLIKQAIWQEATQLAAAGILEQAEDIFWLSLAEIKETIAAKTLDRNLIAMRQAKFRREAKLTPPRVITSEGEIIAAQPMVQVPEGTLVGSPVSAGTVEGRARVVLKLEEAQLAIGEILVAPYTDPAWTPLFPLAAGLVTETGGLMTHGAVVAREYGIPAVVGVDQATRTIRDGQRIRVNGTLGVVELLD